MRTLLYLLSPVAIGTIIGLIRLGLIRKFGESDGLDYFHKVVIALLIVVILASFVIAVALKLPSVVKHKESDMG